MKLTKNTLAAGALTLALGLAFPVAARAQDGGEMPKQDEKKPEEKKPEEKKPEEKKPEEKKPEEPRPGRGPGGGGGRRGGFGGFNMEQLQKDLGLTQEQVDKINEVQDELRQKMRDMFQGGGGGDRGAMREKMMELQKEGREKVRGLLKDDQKPKFDEFVKKQDERMQGMGRGGPGGGPGGFGMNAEQRKKQLMDEAEKSLVLSAEEKSAIMPLVEKAIDARTTARTDGDKRREEFLGNVKKGGTPEEIKGKLDDYRKARDGEQEKVKAAQKALREVLTVEQEARLVALGILD